MAITDKVIGAKVSLSEYGTVCYRAGLLNKTVSQYVKDILLKPYEPTLFENGGELKNETVSLKKQLSDTQEKLKKSNDLFAVKDNEISSLKKQLSDTQEKLKKSNDLLSKLQKENEQLNEKYRTETPKLLLENNRLKSDIQGLTKDIYTIVQEITCTSKSANYTNTIRKYKM